MYRDCRLASNPVHPLLLGQVNSALCTVPTPHSYGWSTVPQTNCRPIGRSWSYASDRLTHHMTVTISSSKYPVFRCGSYSEAHLNNLTTVSPTFGATLEAHPALEPRSIKPRPPLHNGNVPPSSSTYSHPHRKTVPRLWHSRAPASRVLDPPCGGVPYRLQSSHSRWWFM